MAIVKTVSVNYEDNEFIIKNSLSLSQILRNSIQKIRENGLNLDENIDNLKENNAKLAHKLQVAMRFISEKGDLDEFLEFKDKNKQ